MSSNNNNKLTIKIRKLKILPKEQPPIKIKVVVDKEEWLTSYTIEKLFFHLVSIEQEITPKDKEKEKLLEAKGLPSVLTVKKYYRQAKELMRWIPFLQLPSNEFVINISDLTPKLKKEIESMMPYPNTIKYVLTQAVGRIFENLDFEYYHNSIARNLRVRLEP